MKQQLKAFVKVIDWIKGHVPLLLVLGGIILLLCTLKTQTVLLTDAKTEQYSIELRYSVFGYCVSAMPMTSEAQPIAADHMFLLDGIDESVEKVATWIAEKGDSGVKIYTNGYPRKNDDLIAHLIEMLAARGIDAEKLEAVK